MVKEFTSVTMSDLFTNLEQMDGSPTDTLGATSVSRITDFCWPGHELLANFASKSTRLFYSQGTCTS